MIVNLLRNLPDFYCGESITSSDHIVLNDMYFVYIIYTSVYIYTHLAFSIHLESNSWLELSIDFIYKILTHAFN